MSELTPRLIGVGDKVVDLSREALIDARGAPVPLRPRAWLVLRLLAQQAGRLVGKDELMERVWTDCIVTEDSLVQAIGDVRRALGDPALVRTLPRRGYMLMVTDKAARLGDQLRSQAAARFVGRELELRQLADAIAQQPEAPLHYLHGPGGIGKSALLERLHGLAQAARIGWLALDASGVPATPEGLLAALALALDLSLAHSLEALLQDWPEGRCVLVIDSFEGLEPLAAWLRDTLLPALPAWTTVVLSGRNRPDSHWTTHPLWGEALQSLALRPLAREESAALLAAYGASPASSPVLDLCHGHPLALVLAAGELRRGGELPGALGPALVETLIERCVGQAPSPLHRQALEVCARVRTTTAALLCSLVDAEAGPALFDWLRGQDYVSVNSQGLRPHDLVREAIDAHLLQRDPARSRELQHALDRYLIQKMLSGQEAWQALFELHFVERHSAVMRDLFDITALGSISIGAPRPADEAGIARLRDAGLPPGEQRRFDHWKQHPATRCRVARRGNGQVCGVTLILELDALDEASAAGDPVVLSALRALDETLRQGRDSLSLMSRFTVPEGERQPRNPAMNALQLCHSLHWATEPGLRWWVIAAHHPDRFAALLEASRFRRLQACEHLLDGILPTGCFVHDWQAEPWPEWRQRMAEPAA